jgi:hypothetical protein
LLNRRTSENYRLTKINSIEVLFIGYLAANNLHENYFFKAYKYLISLILATSIDYSRFIRKINRLMQEIGQIFMF